MFLVLPLIFPSVTDRAIGRLPVLHEGRIKPFDTLSRHYLLQIQGRLRLPNNQTPTQWLFSMMTVSPSFENEPLILVEHPKLFDSIDIKFRKQKYRLSESFLNQHIDLIQPFISSAIILEKEERSPFQQAAFVLSRRYLIFRSLRTQFFPFQNGSQLEFWNTMLNLSHSMSEDRIENSSNFSLFLKYYDELKQLDSVSYFIFSSDWQTLPQAALDKTQSHKRLLTNYLLLSDAYNQWALRGNLSNDDHLTSRIQTYSNRILSSFRSLFSSEYLLLELEYWFNILNPFIVSLFLYMLAIFLVFLTRFLSLQYGRQYIFITWVTALTFHGFGLLCRMIILMRPPS